MKKIILTITASTLMLLFTSSFFTNFTRKGKTETLRAGEAETKINQSKLMNFNNTYENYSRQEKKYYDLFIENNKEKIPFNYFISSYPEGAYKDFLRLIYADENVILVFISNEKRGGNLYLYDTKNNKEIGNNQDFGIINIPLIHSKYAVFPCLTPLKEESFCYYKASDLKINLVENSTLKDTQETYVLASGFDGEVNQLSLDEKTNTLKISVFKNENKEDMSNTKLREVEFVLP